MRNSFLTDVVNGLEADAKSIPSKYFYDARGSRLFEEITDLEEYYPTRTELAIMERHVGEMGHALGPRCLLVEYGSGSSRKTRVLLEAMEDPAGYVPIDISGEHLRLSAQRLSEQFPDLVVHPVRADYTAHVELPEDTFESRRTVVYFPGSTIGNFEPAAAGGFLQRINEVAGRDGGLLIGVDLQKNRTVLESAYNDAKGVTAAFNRNLIHRINSELGGTLDPEAFRHEALYNEREGRIEMYLIAEHAQSTVLGGRDIRIGAGERIHTEHSYKYTVEGFDELARGAGFYLRDVWTDARHFFSVMYLETS